MQGTIINHKGEAVKAAEISVRKIASVSKTGTLDAKDESADPLDQHMMNEVARVQTDEEGTFTLENLDPNAEYVFEIRLKESIHENLSDNIQTSYIAAPIRSVDTMVSGHDVRLGLSSGKNTVSGSEIRNDSQKNGWNTHEDGRDDREDEDWSDQDDDWSDQDDDWNDQDEDWNDQDDDWKEVWTQKKAQIEPIAGEHLINTAASENDDDYDDSEWFDIQEQEVMEQYAGNMIKPKKDLEDKLITIRKYIW